MYRSSLRNLSRRTRITPPQYVSLRSFRRCNTEDLLTDLKEAPWSVMDIYDDIDDKWMYWKGLFLQVVDRHAPVLTFRKKRGSHPWVTGEILQLMQKRNFFRKKFHQTKDQNYWERYKHLRGQVIRALRAAKTEYFKNVCTDIGKNPRKAWNQLNSLMGKKASKVDTLVKDNLILQVLLMPLTVILHRLLSLLLMNRIFLLAHFHR